MFKGGVLLACLVALVLPACGSDDDDSGGDGGATDAEPLTHEELVDQAAEACQVAQQSTDKLNEQLGEEADVFAPEAAPLLEDLAGITSQLVADLEALEPPAGDAADYESLIELLDDGTTKVEGMAAAVEDDDRQTAVSLQNELNASGDEIEQVTTDLGLSACLDN